MNWLAEFSEAAARTDRFVGNPNHAELLAAGLMGEAGSILAEVKKEQRERDAYPAYHRKLLEETGDFLWYYVRLVTVLDPALLTELEIASGAIHVPPQKKSISSFLDLGGRVGALLSTLSKAPKGENRPLLLKVWLAIDQLSHEIGVSLQVAASENILKIESRWPRDRIYRPLFDENFPEEEQLPRHLDIEFRERDRGTQKNVILRCNGINFGDRLTDNIEDPDWYRYHDIFHFAYAVYLGWSPVIRALLHCKRKSKPEIDEAQDGARASIIEEAVSAIVFSHAKQLNFFEGVDHVDYDLLKSIRGFIEGYEVYRVPLWQWEVAILDGYRIFRHLRNNRGGRVMLDLSKHQISYIATVVR